MEYLVFLVDAAVHWAFHTTDPDSLRWKMPERGWQLAAQVVQVLNPEQREELRKLLPQDNETLALYDRTCAITPSPGKRNQHADRDKWHAVAEVLKGAAAPESTSWDCFWLTASLAEYDNARIAAILGADDSAQATAAYKWLKDARETRDWD